MGVSKPKNPAYHLTIDQQCFVRGLIYNFVQEVHIKSRNSYAYDPNLFNLLKLEPEVLAVSSKYSP